MVKKVMDKVEDFLDLLVLFHHTHPNLYEAIMWLPIILSTAVLLKDFFVK